MRKYINQIEALWEIKDSIKPGTEHFRTAKKTVKIVIDELDNGLARVLEKKEDNSWHVNQWAKKAILLAFKFYDNEMMSAGVVQWYDKFYPKYNSNYWEEDHFAKAMTRIVPGAFIRKGAYIAKNTVIMPSFINIGAFIDEGTMIDSWATVGSCAYVGKNCHISMGVGIGGVLEPLQAQPVIIEDNCFIGAGSKLAEGIIVEEGAVLGMGVLISASTKIIVRDTGEVIYGKVPAYSVVISGTIPGSDPSKPHLACAVIVKQVDKQTKSKTSINELLRY